jgi:hypothetical protein
MSEKSFWTLLRNNLKLKAYRVENKVMKGMPDVHYIKNGKSGWLELKYLDKWPKKRITTGLMLNQALWLYEYSKNKGSCWILVRVERDFTCLIKGEHALSIHKRPSSPDFFNYVHWQKRGNMSSGDWEELTDKIT